MNDWKDLEKFVGNSKTNLYWQSAFTDIFVEKRVWKNTENIEIQLMRHNLLNISFARMQFWESIEYLYQTYNHTHLQNQVNSVTEWKQKDEGLDGLLTSSEVIINDWLEAKEMIMAEKSIEDW